MSWKSVMFTGVAATALAGAGVVARPALADTINASGLEQKNVTIEKMDGDQVFFKTQNGVAGAKTINEKLRLNLTDEPSFNAAEEAFANAKFPDAVDAYQKTVRSTNKPWLKEFSALRLVISADHAKRFDAAVSGYLTLLDLNPKTAADHKPKLPEDPNSTYLKTADSMLENAIKSEKDQGKVMSLLAFDLDVARALKDDAKVATIAKKLSDAAGNGATAVGVDPAIAQAALEGQISVLKVDLDKGDYAGAQKILAQVKPSIVDAGQQADWLWLNAEAQYGAAKDSKDPTVLKNVALDYMRLVANFPNHAKASQALLKTAEIHEKLADTKTAVAIYQQVAKEYEHDPEGTKAKQSAERLQAAGNK